MSVIYIQLFIVFCYAGLVTPIGVPSAKKSKVWGPGLESAVVLPARYFYIHAADKNGKLYKESPGEKAFEVTMAKDTQGSRFRCWTQVLDRHDGSFLVLYRAYESVDKVFINVKYNGKHVADSPYVLEGFYHENCNCPQENSSSWAKVMKCPKKFQQIEKDLSKFHDVDLEKVAAEAIERFGKNHALVHYALIDQKIYRRTFGQHVGFAQFMDSWLHSLLRKVKLPDMEFFVNLGDWPLEFRAENPLPIFSWCGSEETQDIVMPTYDITQSVSETLGRISLNMLSVQANTGPKWEDKIPKAFWRGRDSRQERLDFVVKARKNTELFDAALTNFFFFKYDEAKYGPKGQHVSFYDFFKYKYQVTIDGTVAAYRMPYLLAGDTLVFKQDSGYYEHFYKELQPWVHYVPFKRDSSDIEELLQWAKSHDKEAQKIALQGRDFVRENLAPEQIFCYYFNLLKLDYSSSIEFGVNSSKPNRFSWASVDAHIFNGFRANKNGGKRKRISVDVDLETVIGKNETESRLIQSFAKLQKTKPKIYDDMEYIAQPEDKNSRCDCKRKKMEPHQEL